MIQDEANPGPVGAEPPSVEVTLKVDAKTYARFERARLVWEEKVGAAPDLAWLMSFALQLADPDEAVDTADRMALDLLLHQQTSV